jgi:hypothetical protein
MFQRLRALGEIIDVKTIASTEQCLYNYLI